MKKNITITVFIISVAFSSFGFEYPGEPEIVSDHSLFTIERSRSEDFIAYEINMDSSGEPDETDPIKIFWIKKSEDNRKEPLTWIQNLYGYGIELMDNTSGANGEWQFRIVSFPERTFTMSHKSGNQYHVYTHIAGRDIEVEKIYVNFINDKFWNPGVSHVILYGIDLHSGETISNTIASST